MACNLGSHPLRVKENAPPRAAISLRAFKYLEALLRHRGDLPAQPDSVTMVTYRRTKS
jgi:hypothetical protein